jgi:hypothetical protein
LYQIRGFYCTFSPETPSSGEFEDNFRAQWESKFTKAFSEIPCRKEEVLRW